MRGLAACIGLVLLAGCTTAEPQMRAVEAQRAVAAPHIDSAGSTERLPRSVRRVSSPGQQPPRWLGERLLPVGADGLGVAGPTPPALRSRRFTLRDTVPALPGHGFAARVSPATARVLARSTWHPGCPVAARELAWVRTAFWGFDDRRHTGELLVHSDVAADVVAVFRRLYAIRFPLEEVRITRREELDAPPTGDGNNTTAFVCRRAVGQTEFSQHAYGLALDLNPFHNPYVRGTGPARVVLPELASAYVDRRAVRPGMVLPGSEVVAAFARVGWEWGGDWQSLQDPMHFSLTGR